MYFQTSQAEKQFHNTPGLRRRNAKNVKMTGKKKTSSIVSLSPIFLFRTPIAHPVPRTVTDSKKIAFEQGRRRHGDWGTSKPLTWCLECMIQESRQNRWPKVFFFFFFFFFLSEYSVWALFTSRICRLGPVIKRTKDTHEGSRQAQSLAVKSIFTKWAHSFFPSSSRFILRLVTLVECCLLSGHFTDPRVPEVRCRWSNDGRYAGCWREKPSRQALQPHYTQARIDLEDMRWQHVRLRPLEHHKYGGEKSHFIGWEKLSQILKPRNSQ